MRRTSYRVPCRAFANGYRILSHPTALQAVLSTPPLGGVLNTSSSPTSGGTTFYATLPRQ
eukprot:11750264-Ditylum_brightwellii.AAC.1